MGLTWLWIWIPTPEEEFRMRNEAEFRERHLLLKTKGGMELSVTKMDSNAPPLPIKPHTVSSPQASPSESNGDSKSRSSVSTDIDNDSVFEPKGIVNPTMDLPSILDNEKSPNELKARSKKSLKIHIDHDVYQDTLNLPTSDSSKRHSVSSGVQWVEFASLQDRLQLAMDTMKIKHFTKQNTGSGQYLLYSFCVPEDKTETHLICLQRHGIGSNARSSISLMTSPLQLGEELFLEDPEEEFQESKEKNAKRHSTKSDRSEASKLEQKVDKFYNSIKSRMLVAEVIARIKSGGEFTFDYIMLLFLAGCIAFMGLIENSSVVLVASMLVSPLMGPILAGIFGTVIKDRKLRRSGITHEVISLIICILTGAVFGLIFAPWIGAYGVTQWPTPEMLSRGQLRSLLSGVLIAIPSGAGVALSVLGGNAGSLVGVAISASLLPPAVNCGLFCAISIISALSQDGNYLIGYELDDGLLRDNGSNSVIYTPSYSENLALEAAYLGIVSFLLTIVNIICIIITGILLLKLKEVTPDKIPQSFSTFWKEDIKVHRSYNQIVKRGDPLEQMNIEAKDVLGGEVNDYDYAKTFVKNAVEKAQEENSRINIKEWVSMPPVMGRFQKDPVSLVSKRNSRSASTALTDQAKAFQMAADTLYRQSSVVEEVTITSRTSERDGSQST
ncbi:uncharacterized protein LOC131884929 [Tigriopus californicus]|uniref:uncharacterized protein LOC131884929 n=1 Tax=Tigriopus californicus TaxID=6832 RepID=UPI0027DAB36E|nr:uncharacterized protein LOC131884929 [Tigriopus californicus]XP_059088809.1 uncharacterized protein LOC131884929 [Tigriopus californicus]|eukprot:TCALIF_13148-PA protein Name:"Similar to MJ1221 Uncharacterized protein MJ1221 (Methanocaldococcus jannaschii (strain ATCC 43067 / DSM 2661 / JAL-1 / JCM 10045 / NBRC 100440))" AED:0.31 eAED:0.58 QI:0/-1/0/1/-1/1/1/0/669